MKSDTIVFHCSLLLLVLFVQFTLCIPFAFVFVTLCSAPKLSCCLESCSTIKYLHSKFHLIQNICDSMFSANVLTALVCINQDIRYEKYHLKCVSIDPVEREEIDNKKPTWYCRECLKAVLPFNSLDAQN